MAQSVTYKLLALVLGAWVLIIALACLAGCMRCDPFQLACPSGKVCVNGYCQNKCGNVQVRDVEKRVFFTSDCYTCLPNTAPGAFDEGNHYRCKDDLCSECEVPPVPFGAHRPDAGAR